MRHAFQSIKAAFPFLVLLGSVIVLWVSVVALLFGVGLIVAARERLQGASGRSAVRAHARRYFDAHTVRSGRTLLRAG